MDVFDLREHVVRQYAGFTRSFTTIRAVDLKARVNDLYAQDIYWPQPLLSLNPAFAKGPSTRELAQRGDLMRDTADMFDLSLHRHQEEALSLCRHGHSYVVTTGTGSGKSLCFFLPMVDAILREKQEDPRPRIRAIVIYPMNALANSQLEELDKFIGKAKGHLVRYARLTGQEDQEQREAIRRNPPDILLTNFMMLELLMTRRDELDRQIVQAAHGLRFLVLDELHTYRGRQGADVAMLVRRLRERLEPTRLQCIGTSATMVSEGSHAERNATVARVASTLFATEIRSQHVVTETLRRATDPARNRSTVRAELAGVLDAPLPAGLANTDLENHPLAIWIECVLGLEGDLEKPRRAKPKSVAEAARALAEDSGRPSERCEAVLKQFMTLLAQAEKDRVGHGQDRAFMAFKLHQFISGSGALFVTLDPPGERHVTLEGQVFRSGQDGARLYTTYFCRTCGHEAHAVLRHAGADGVRFLSRDLDDPQTSPTEQDGTHDPDMPKADPGYLVPIPPDDPDWTFTGILEDYPEAWLDPKAKGEPRLQRAHADHKVHLTRVAPDGQEGSGQEFWWIKGRFRFCLRCGVTHAAGSRDGSRLASLSFEGRSSATTVLLTAALSWLHRPDAQMPERERRLLDFTDNRQDAALQAGHFNDFTFVGLVRAAAVRALQEAGAEGLTDANLGRGLMSALGFLKPARLEEAERSHRRHWLKDTGLLGRDLEEAEALMAKVLAHRFWADQRRGWRYANPNLEPLGLLHVSYTDLDKLARDDQAFAACLTPGLRMLAPSDRVALLTAFLDELRRGLAVDAASLDPVTTEMLRDQSRKDLKAPWAISHREGPLRTSRWLSTAELPKGAVRGNKEDSPLFSSGPQSSMGKRLRSGKFWGGYMQAKDYIRLRDDLIQVTWRAGLLRHNPHTNLGVPGYQLNSDRLRLLAGKGEPDEGPGNAYFRDLHLEMARLLGTDDPAPLAFEAREHTAQVDPDLRVHREMRFRYGARDAETLATGASSPEVAGEGRTMLPVLICSPTMELGVDISQLHTVYMRNVPPTPANYAQRSGRAGRSGQAALVVTYCAARSPHDQYFFRDPKAMVHGEVRPPILDLANQELVNSHLQAVWLSEVEHPLGASIVDVLHIPDPARPLRHEVRTAAVDRGTRERALVRAEGVLSLVEDHLAPGQAPWFTDARTHATRVIDGAAQAFDGAFQRWRDLLGGAERLRDHARAVIDDYGVPAGSFQKIQAATWQADAERQRTHLLESRESASSDFYLYRYLATEGFLPGYNFPRLPLLAYLSEGARAVQATARNRRKPYVQRPRFLALSEFGPQNLIYHEGRAYRVQRVQMTYGGGSGQGSGSAGPEPALRQFQLCQACGAGHEATSAATCHHCGKPLDDALTLSNILGVEQVHAVATERITADDEERRRQGFLLRSTWRWPERQGRLDIRRLTASDEAGDLVHLTFGAGATIYRLNLGLKRRKLTDTGHGFALDPASGRWVREASADNADTAPEDQVSTLKVVPMVRDTKNALLLEPGSSWSPRTFVTVHHALKRGIEVVFQLESSELLGEVLGQGLIRTGVLYYEATEGGAGVLSRLAGESGALPRVARAALELMHLDLPDELAGLDARDLGDIPGTSCVAGCYRCLLSYANQTDHESLDRRDPAARQILLRLARTEPLPDASGDADSVPPGPGDAPFVTGLAGVWLEAFTRHVPQAPHPELARFGDVVVPRWPDVYAAVALPDLGNDLRENLEDAGYSFIRFGTDESRWPERFTQLARLMGVDQP